MKRGAAPPTVLIELTPRQGSRCLQDLASSVAAFYSASDVIVAANTVLASRTYVVRAIIHRLYTINEDGFAKARGYDMISLSDDQTLMSPLDGGASLAHWPDALRSDRRRSTYAPRYQPGVWLLPRQWHIQMAERALKRIFLD